ncbi:MAG: 2Fe-2S iron-sulfur cluster-binding protein, partial [Burkholderiaceae bacterium]
MAPRTLIRNVRLVSGLVLMAFVISHLANLALGMHSLGAMGAARPWLLDPWRSGVGGILLIWSASIHAALGLYAISARRSWSMSRTDIVQLVLGLLTPPMLITHVVATHMAAQYDHDFNFVYGQMLAVYWSFAPRYAFQQLFVVMIVWIHGALGLYSWMVLLPSWRRIGGIVLPVLFAIPILALLGFAESGREVLERLDSDPQWKDMIIAHLRPIADMVAQIDAAKDLVLMAYAGLVALALAVMLWRTLRARAQPVRVEYDGGDFAVGRRGLSVLEISTAADVPHAHVCSGRGRCGTCRVQVEQGAQWLSPLNDLEETTLARV